jgi:hypothetical protein
LRNSLFSPASSENLPTVAFHLPSGEQGGRSLHGVLGILAISKVRAALPISIMVSALKAYRTRMFAIATSGASGTDFASILFGVSRTRCSWLAGTPASSNGW